MMSRAAIKKAEKARQNRRDMLLGLAIIGTAAAVYFGSLIAVAMV